MAHANAVTGSTHYVPEGDPAPGDLHPDVRLVGPGAVAAESVAESVVVPGPQPGSTPPGNSGESSAPADYDAHPIRVLRDLVRDRGLPVAGSKAELVARLTEHDEMAAF